MQPQLPLVRARVALLPELPQGRTLSERQYRPHIVLGPEEQRQALIAEGNVLTESYFGIAVWSGPEMLTPGQEATVEFVLSYWSYAPDAYRGVVPGATFTIREGPNIVGSGRFETRVDPTST